MPTQVGKRVAMASAVHGTSKLSRSHRQLLAIAYDEAARRGAVSIQTKLTSKGAMICSTYFDWPPRGAGEEDDEKNEEVP